MKISLISLLLLFTTFLFSQTKLLSWNIENFGKSKSETQLNFIANTIKDYDIITIQEVVAGYGGAQSITKLVEILNQKGSKWDYQISAPTSSSAYKTERYAFIWKTSKAKLKGKAWLEKNIILKLTGNLILPLSRLVKKPLLLLRIMLLQKIGNLKQKLNISSFYLWNILNLTWFL